MKSISFDTFLSAPLKKVAALVKGPLDLPKMEMRGKELIELGNSPVLLERMGSLVLFSQRLEGLLFGEIERRTGSRTTPIFPLTIYGTEEAGNVLLYSDTASSVAIRKGGEFVMHLSELSEGDEVEIIEVSRLSSFQVLGKNWEVRVLLPPVVPKRRRKEGKVMVGGIFADFVLRKLLDPSWVKEEVFFTYSLRKGSPAFAEGEDAVLLMEALGVFRELEEIVEKRKGLEEEEVVECGPFLMPAGYEGGEEEWILSNVLLRKLS